MANSGQNAPLLVERSNQGVYTLTLNRPDKLNALSEALLAALSEALGTIAADESARCVVLSGAGKAFCAGHDLAEMRASPALNYYKDLFSRCGKVMQSIVALPVPVIARVQGVATAAGCQLVASCDLALAARSARFAVSGINVGLFCATPAVALSRAILPKQAFDMLVTGEFISADEAAARGLITSAVDDDALDAAVAAKVAVILGKDSKAIRYGKAMFQRQLQMPLSEAYDFASDVMARNMMEPETLASVEGFVTRKKG